MKNKIARVIKSEKSAKLLLAVFLIVGLLVRLYKINSPIADWHSWRQVDTAAVARIFVDEGINLLEPRYYDISSVQTGYFNPQGYRFVEFPISNLIHAVAFMAIPQISFDIWGRLISVFSALIAGFYIYKIGCKYIGKVGGLASMFFYLFLPFNIYFTRVILPEPMATMFAVVSIWYFVQFIESDKNWQLYLSAALFSMAILLKPFAGFYALPIIFLAIRKFGFSGLFKKIPMLLALDIALVPFFAWRAWLGQFRYFIGIPHFMWAFNGDGIRFRPAFWRWIFGERLGHLILGTWGLIPFGFGILDSSKIRKRDWVIELMLLGMLGYVVIVATASVRHDYYQTIVVPAVALALGRGAQVMLKKRNTAILLVFSSIMMIGMSAYLVKENYKVNHPEFVEVGNIVDQTIPKDAQIIAPDNGNTVFLYYTKRRGWPVLEESIEGAIEKGADYYVSVNNDADTSRFKTMFKTVSQGDNYVLLDLHQKIDQ